MTHHWSADLIAADDDFAGAPLLRKEFTLDAGHGDVVAATLHVTAHGIVEPTLNGVAVSADVFTPGWTSYEWRLRYRDATTSPRCSWRRPSVLGLALGNGWFRGRLGWSGQAAPLRLRAGRPGRAARSSSPTATARSSGPTSTWQAGPSDDHRERPLRRPDHRRAGWPRRAWTLPGADLTGLGRGPRGRRRRLAAPAVRRTAGAPPGGAAPGRGLDLPVRAPPSSTSGRTSSAGCASRVQGPAGREITVRHAEVLEHDELGIRPLRSAQATDRFILSGGVDIFEPTKTFHGFRYAEVTGWPGRADAPTRSRRSSSTPSCGAPGTFECSDELLNQLHRNVVWGLTGNFLDVPTDCPQRDERLGWTGDLAVVRADGRVPLRRLGLPRRLAGRPRRSSSEHADGLVPFVVPDVLKYVEHPPEFPAPESTAIWSDAAVWVPWALWEAYGDRAVLDAAATPRCARTPAGSSGCSPTPACGTPASSSATGSTRRRRRTSPIEAKADNGVVATACYYRTLRAGRRAAAEILGRTDDAGYFSALADRIRAAFNKHYVTDGGTDHSATAPPSTPWPSSSACSTRPTGRAPATGWPSWSRENGYRISTGFAGTPFVTGALTSTGHLDDAYRLLLERECPSWLYSGHHGRHHGLGALGLDAPRRHASTPAR